MTPDQLAVERDRLLEGGRTPEQVRAMQAGPQLLDALCLVALEFGRDMDIDGPRDIFSFVGEALEAAHDRHVYESQSRGIRVLESLQPENRPGASVPRPSGETT